MQISLIRHAETDYSQEKVVGEFPGPPLSKKGIIQAKHLAKSLLNEQPDLVFCSDMRRTMQTLKPLKENIKCPIETDSRIREIDDIVTGYSSENSLQETEKEQRERLQSFLNELKHLKKEHVWILCHFNVIVYLSEKIGKTIKKPEHARRYILHLK